MWAGVFCFPAKGKPMLVKLLAAAAAAVLVPAGLLATRADEARSKRAAVVATPRPVAFVAVPKAVPDVYGAAAAVNEAVGAYLDALAVAAYLDALAAEQEARLAAEAAAATAARASRPSGNMARPATVGECTGFAIPAYIIQRESGGDPSASNPSGAYGCAQTLLSHYSPGGSCAGLDPYSIDGQRQCVWILSNGGTNLAPWAATR